MLLNASAALPCLNLRTDLLGSLHWLGSGRDIKWHVQLYILNKRRGQVWISDHLRCLYLIMPQCRYLSCRQEWSWESKDEGFGRKATHYWSLSYHSGNAMQRKTRSSTPSCGQLQLGFSTICFPWMKTLPAWNSWWTMADPQKHFQLKPNWMNVAVFQHDQPWTAVYGDMAQLW